MKILQGASMKNIVKFLIIKILYFVTLIYSSFQIMNKMTSQP